MRDTSVIEVDLGAVARNLEVLRRLVGPGVGICPVVKADAYGLGAVPVARWLERCGVEMLAVYTRAEVAELLAAGIARPVLALMPLRHLDDRDDLLAGLAVGRVHLTVHDAGQLDDLLALGERARVTVPVHLDVDTGMSRGGCDLAAAPGLLRRIATAPRLRLAGVATHFASSETDPAFTAAQDARFQRLLTACADVIPAGCLVHVANTGATITDRRLHRSMVRVGQAWAGLGRESIAGPRVRPEADELRPCLRWTSTIVHTKRIESGTPVGYRSAWRAARPSLIGLVPVGYADGYPFALGTDRDGPAARIGVDVGDGGAAGGARLRFAPVVGRVNMDQITVDLTDLAAAGAEIGPGTPVELITPDPAAPNHLPRLAALAGTTLHEILCRLNSRIRRVHVRPEAALDIEVMAGSRSSSAVAG